METILIISGIITGIFALILIIYLLLTTKKNTFYKQTLSEQTDTLDLSTLSKSINMTNNKINKFNTFVKTETMLTEAVNIFENNTTIDISILDNKYELIQEIYGGGMSRIFLARNLKVGNNWILKFIDNKNIEIANETNILKRLNHTNLPSIVDIFYDRNTICLVESYIEGLSLQEILKADVRISQGNILNWFEQLSQVIFYLHSLKPSPIIHCDLKPSNIMITPDKNLVLIDFGISKIHGEDDGKYAAVTYKYAAPEQLKHEISGFYKQLIKSRFNELPKERIQWNIDQRTDIYSLGVMFFELIVGEIPTTTNFYLLKEKTSKEMANIIYKCLQINPDNRFQNMTEVIHQIQIVRNIGITMTRSIVMRRVLSVATLLLVVISGATITGGNYIIKVETLSVLAMSPDVITVSEQQAGEFKIEKYLPDGSEVIIDSSSVSWSFENDNIARIEGNKIAGLNEGKTTVTGKYKNKIITLTVNVIKEIKGMVNVSLRYKKGNTVDNYAGNGTVDTIDGDLKTASFISPTSIAMDDEGYIYVVDATVIRLIEPNGAVGTISFEESYILPKTVRCQGTDLYVLTQHWEDSEEKKNYYAILKMNETETTSVFLGEADYSLIEDFFIVNDELMYYLEFVEPLNATMLSEFNLKTGEAKIIQKLNPTVNSLTVANDKIYLGDSTSGVIYKLDLVNSELSYLAGIENEKNFIDGTIPMLYEPIKIKAFENSIYVLDFNIVRKITLKDGILETMETVAGEPVADFNPKTTTGEAENAIFAHSVLAEFIVSKDKIIITDPKNFIIKEINLGGN